MSCSVFVPTGTNPSEDPISIARLEPTFYGTKINIPMLLPIDHQMVREWKTWQNEVLECDRTPISNDS